MDENITPGGDTPPPPPPGSHEQPAAGPRVSATDMRDVARLRRSATDKHIAGVAGGLARHLDVDPLLVRIGFVVAALFGGVGVLLYGALWLLVPSEADDRAVIDLDDRNRSIAVLLAGGIAALAFIGNALGGVGAGDRDGFVFPLVPIAVVALIVWLVLRRRDRRTAHPGPVAPGTATSNDPRAARAAFNADVKAHPEKYRDINSWTYAGDPQSGYRWVRDPRKKGPLLFWIAIPLIALALGVLGTVDLAGTDVIPAAYPALALAIVAALLLLGSFWGRAGGLILIGLLLVPVTAVATVADDFEGERVRYAPATVEEIPEFGYRLGAGELVVDLTRIDPATLDGRTIEASIDVGELLVIVPDDADVTARADINGPGGYDVFGSSGGGIDTTTERTQDGAADGPSFTVSAQADLGHIEIRSK
jgi:phage shock protein PspC (stress-responsive transcriptional regulator)